MLRNRFRALTVAALIFVCLTRPVSAQQAPWYVATGSDGTLYLVSQDGYYEITPGTLSDDQLASLGDLGPTGSAGPNGGLGPSISAAQPTAPPAAAAPATPPPAPAAKPGDVLYQADWSQGMNGWTGTPDWKVVGGMMVDDGSSGNGGLTVPSFQTPTPDYAVEAQMQAVGRGGSGGVAVRLDGPENPKYYVGRVDWGLSVGKVGAQLECSFYCLQDIVSKSFTPRGDWHTYRLEAKGNHLRFFIDPPASLLNVVPFLETDDNRLLTGTGVGLWGGGTVNVRSFKVIQL